MDTPSENPRPTAETARDAAEVVGKTAVAAALAGAVAAGAAAVTPDQIHLNDPAPIVQMVDQGVDQVDTTVDDQTAEKKSAWKRLLQILKYALLALVAVAAIVFGVLQAAASCAGPLAAPPAGDASSSGTPQKAA
ncbi:MAG: hypothetical protein IJ131_10685 [Eggerthellaceae bacterium]|nr:hypothetical protein [Eggerthellaceae bacterium]